MWRLLLALSVGAAYDPCADPDPGLTPGTFPPDFLWATATAAFQIEGGWNASGKGPSIWDTFDHQKPNPVKGNATGDVACDSYHNWAEDIRLLQNMGLTSYRLSLSWARILPTGLVKDGVNYDGVRYYGAIFQALKAAGIKPLVTLYHWDLPQALQKNGGGWLNPASSDWFADYARLCYALFGKYVPYWITFNEPWVVSVLGYSFGVFAPGIKNCPGTCPYTATHNIILSHAKAFHAYNDTFRAVQKGQVGMTMNCDFRITNSLNQSDIDATDRAMQFQLGWFAHPIYSKSGDYPPVMKTQMMSRSLAEGRNSSRLPSFSPAQVAYVRGTYDFFGINMYTSYVVKNAPNKAAQQNPPNYNADSESNAYQCGQWAGSGSSWLKYTPWGARGLLKWISDQYGNPPVIVTENGWSDNNGSTFDPYRVRYYKYYINNVLKARKFDGVNVKGYTAWSLMDNMEWASGYTEKFGLHYVDFNDPKRTRKAKMSAAYITGVARSNGFPACGLLAPCVHGNCVNSADGAHYTCVCNKGYTGPNCNVTGSACPVSFVNSGTQLVIVKYMTGTTPRTLYLTGPITKTFNVNSGSSVTLKTFTSTLNTCLIPAAACAAVSNITCTGDSASSLACTCP